MFTREDNKPMTINTLLQIINENSSKLNFNKPIIMSSDEEGNEMLRNRNQQETNHPLPSTPLMEDYLIDTLNELINHGDLKTARRVLEYVRWTFSRYNEYIQKIDNLENPT